MHKSFTNGAARRGFTLIEVMMAAFVLATALLGCLSALTQCFQLIDDARNKTLACQIIQREIETSRLFSFKKVQELPAVEAITMADDVAALGRNFSGKRFVTDVADCVDANGAVTMKQVMVEVNWNDFRGLSHSHRYTTYYGKGGLSDYFVTNRPTI